MLSAVKVCPTESLSGVIVSPKGPTEDEDTYDQYTYCQFLLDPALSPHLQLSFFFKEVIFVISYEEVSPQKSLTNIYKLIKLTNQLKLNNQINTKKGCHNEKGNG